MSKTPEELAEEFADFCLTTNAYTLSKAGFLAGYKAAQEHAHAALEESEARMWEIKDQVAGVSKVMPQWISVKGELPPKGEWVLFWYPWGHEVNKLKWVGPKGQLDFHRDYYGESESEDGGPSHWMPLPEPPKEES